jgi:hypothetical protein
VTRPAKTTTGAVRTDCGRCGAPTLRQPNGLPWTVTADAEPMPLARALALTGPNRLAWCLKTSRWSGDRLTEMHTRSHPADCPHPHVIDHECPPGTPAARRPGGGLR